MGVESSYRKNIIDMRNISFWAIRPLRRQLLLKHYTEKIDIEDSK